jgi:hypothetical protein
VIASIISSDLFQKVFTKTLAIAPKDNVGRAACRVETTKAMGPKAKIPLGIMHKRNPKHKC